LIMSVLPMPYLDGSKIYSYVPLSTEDHPFDNSDRKGLNSDLVSVSRSEPSIAGHGLKVFFSKTEILWV
jgi:hypothetical protein